MTASRLQLRLLTCAERMDVLAAQLRARVQKPRLTLVRSDPETAELIHAAPTEGASP